MATSDIGNSGGSIRNAVLIAGPTASGKSRLAVELAERLNGVVINADSMQVYSVLSVITARPDEADLARARHELYGDVHPSQPWSAGAWLRSVEELHAGGALGDKRPIFVGGTGLYFRGLVQGIADMPDIPDAIRQRWRQRLLEEGPGPLHEALSQMDAPAAAQFRPSDGQRIVRALEVFEASGKSILAWQAEPARPLIDAASATRLVLEPPRADLVSRIDARLDRMVAEGGLAEVETLLSLHLNPALPALKAIGVPELSAAILGQLRLAEALDRARISTRQYAKRQTTWFRHQLDESWHRGGTGRDLISLVKPVT